MSAPKEILDLVERFERNLEAYRSGQYNETQLRREFLDPFFKALGWDIENEQGLAEGYKDVAHEDRPGDGGRAPDYAFRIGGTRKFFLEAKKPAINIKDDPSPAFQLRRYGWTNSLPLNVLSDFEEFAVYDCRFKPDHRDSAAIGRILYIRHTEYAQRWDEIAGIFSKEAVLKGYFDKFAESTKAKRGTAAMDEEFLKTIEGWRTELARNVALRNPRLTQRELNFAVQRVIDRVVFLRICEGRGIEDYGRLLALTNGDRIYPRLCQFFEAADARYNSGLFHFQPEPGRREAPDALTLGLEIDDKLLRGILRGLYHPESPYVFSDFPADILGNVYEQFLGKVIRLTEGHQANVEEKPEVKKAGGVYYTPTYIVDYIVRQTVGKLIEEIVEQACKSGGPGGLDAESGKVGKREGGPPASEASLSPAHSPTFPPAANPRAAARILDRVSQLRILDPACGSGSFLIGAYQYLLNWHLQFYTANDAHRWTKSKKPALVQTTKGWRLTVAERKRILLNNIFGVDIDAQAVEVTKLSLLLKVLEGETQQTIEPLFRIFHERALPDLGDNIKCGNSLIGPDFYEQQQLALLDDDERYRINVFDWQAEFPQIFRRRSSTGELHDAPPAMPLDYNMPGVPLHGRYAYRKPKPEKDVSPVPLEPEWDGGFDAVIGNPPYVRQESLSKLKKYFERRYEAFDGTADLYAYFLEKGVRLLRDGGLFSIIVSGSFLRATYGEALRRTLRRHAAVLRIVDFGGLPVFAHAKDTYVCIPLLAKGARQGRVEVSKVTSLKDLKLSEHVRANHFTIPHERLAPKAWSLKCDQEAAVFEKVMRAGQPLGEYVERKFFRGVTTGLNEAFVIDAETKRKLIAKDRRSAELIHPLLGGEDIRRYNFHRTGLWLIFTRRGVDIEKYPPIREHLAKWKEDLTPKRAKSTKRGRKPGRYQWYEIQDDVAYYEVFDKPKIIFPDICKGPRFSLDRTGVYLANTAYCLGTDDLYLLGVLNSRLFWFAISNISISFGIRAGEYRYRLIYQYMEKVPIRVIDLANAADKARHERMVSLVEQMLKLHQQLAAARTPQEQTALARQIAAADAQIDRLVYELYGLSAEEIKIVEEVGK
ncbi:MAG: Eco57I restriction-modification methylase domain-containing protein [Verrucomicrobia bacterium]|nr:Eco57I restriction-modification methylase domain-containing protein [Verrucomicrobiota bacterium]